MPNRVIRAEINRSESLSSVSVEAELTFRALLSTVDDFGRYDARPKVLKGVLFPLRDSFTPEAIADHLQELAADGCVQLYNVGDHPYLWPKQLEDVLVAFESYEEKSERQKREHMAKFEKYYG